MKNLFYIVLMLVFYTTNAQLDPNGVLILNSGTTAEINAISPQEGALIYNTDTQKTYVYTGSSWEIATGANENWTINGNHQYSNVTGNIGIGITNPEQKLDVKGIAQLGNTGATSGVIHMVGKYNGINHTNIYGSEYSSGATVIGYAIQPKSGSSGYASSAQNVSFSRGLLKIDGRLQFLTASPAQVNVGSDVALTPRLTIANNGNVGIGTSNPNTKLEVAGQVKITGGNPGTGKVLTSDASGLASWHSQPTTDNDWTISGNNLFSAVSGNVGIGTSSPNYKLSIASSTSNAIWQQFSNTDTGDTSSDGYYLGIGNNEDAFVWNAENTALRFYTNNNEKMRISNTGNVGIGTSSPNFRLDVSEASTTNGIGTQEAINIRSTVAGSATTNYGIYANTTPTTTGSVTTNYSIFGDVNMPSGGTATNTYGVFGRSLISGTVTNNTFGVYGSSDILSGGTVTNAIEGGRFSARVRSGGAAASAYGIISTAQHEGSLSASNYAVYSVAQPQSGGTVESNFAAYNYAGIPAGGTVNVNNFGTYSNADIFGTVSNANFANYSIGRVRGGTLGGSNYGVYAHTGHIDGTITESNFGVYSYSPGDENSSVGTNYAGYFNADHQGSVTNNNFGIYAISRTRDGGSIGGSNYVGYFYGAATNSGGGGYGTIAGNNFGLRVIMNSQGVTGGTFGIYQTGDASTENYFQNTVGINTTSGAGILNVNGVATKTGGGVWTVFSDKRSKENIKNYTKGLNELIQLRPVRFNYKKSFGFGSDTHVGFIAQEVEKVVPTMVTEADMHGIKDFKQVDANEVTFMLINAVKELKSENESLKKRLEYLEKSQK